MMNMLSFKNILQITHWPGMLFSKQAVLEKFDGRPVVKAIYKKGIQDDLTAEQKKVLRYINERW